MKEMFIICRNTATKGVISFYIEDRSKSYFLFQQKFRHSTYNFYKKGIPVSQAFSYKKTHNDKAIEQVIRRLPAQIAYAEKEYNIAVLNKTKMKKSA